MPEKLKGNGHASTNAYAELRALLVGPEREQIADIQRRMDDPARWVRDLTNAIRLRTTDHGLRLALHPIVEESIRASVQRDPRMLADALYPTIGAAVRKAVASALDDMLLALNQIAERSVSPRSILWRLEAWRTGKSFGEVLLLRSLLYKVEQVFLIHRKTGLLLLHREAAKVVVKDADLVSAMLTAIQDFVRDSFDSTKADLDTVRVDEFYVWIRHGPQAILAGVVRGIAPRELRTVFENTLERITEEQSTNLEHFDGDATPFAACAPYLDACLLGQAQPDKRRHVVAWTVTVLVVLALLTWLFFSIRAQWRWDRYVNTLRSRPGIVVTSAERRGGQYVIVGLHDPKAADPAALLEGSGVPKDRVSFQLQPYLSEQPQFVTAREYDTRKAELERQSLHFATDKSRITPEQWNAVGNIAAEMRTVAGLADRLGNPVHIEIAGHTDDSGTEQRNKELARQRAEAVVAALEAVGAPAGRVTARGASQAESPRVGTSDEDRAVNRSVTFRVFPDKP